MSKKVVISLCVVGLVLATMLILFWTLFGLSSVSVQFDSNRIFLNATEKEIVESGKFHYGVSVLFEGKNKSIENINKHVKENENFAYIRVINIETVFPNKFVIHIVEREELFAVEHTFENTTDGGGQAPKTEYLVCDHEFRVLRKVLSLQEFEDEQQNQTSMPILLKNIEFDCETEDFNVGDFLKIKQTGIKNFYSSMLKNNRDLSEIKGKIKEISLGENIDEFDKTYTSLKITTNSRVYVINNIDFALTYKLQLMFSVESAFFNQKTDENGVFLDAEGEKILMTKTENGEYVRYIKEESNESADNDESLNQDDETQAEIYALTYELLKKCFIKVDNLPLSDFVTRTEKDIYYSICDLDMLSF